VDWSLEHRVRRERLVVDAATPEVAMALRPRLGELNRRVLVPVIDSVLAELAPPGRQVRIERLELDLGEVAAGALEAELPGRLAAELRRALADALRDGLAHPAPGVAWRGEAEARAELLEAQLARGTLPYWAPRSALSLESLVAEMAAGDPARLAAAVRRLGRRRLVLERLAAQLRDPTLAALVRVLEPVHAAVVLAYVTDVRRVHRRAPLLPLGERRFRGLLWVLAHAYLVRDPGSQFNAKSFLRSLLRGLAMEQRVDYAALVATLDAGLRRTRRHRGPGASLPLVVAALLRDLERAPRAHDTVASDSAAAPGFRTSSAAETEHGKASADGGDVIDALDAVGASDPVAAADGTGSERWASGRRSIDPPRSLEGDAGFDDPAARAHPTAASADWSMDAAAIFSPYDRADALAYLLRHGVLPWHAVLRDPALDAEAVAGWLADLPHPLLLAALRPEGPGARRPPLAALARWGLEEGLTRLLARLIPGAARAETPFAQALSEHLAAASDRRAFLARVADAALHGGAIDLPALAFEAAGAGEGAEPRLAEPTAWPAHLIQSVLTRTVRAEGAPDGDDPSPAGLLEALAAAHPADARHYLREVAADDELARSLARSVPDTLLHGRLVELLAPAAVRAVGALRAALAALPAPERPFTGDELRVAVLVEVMRLGEGEAPGETFFARVLARLFGRGLPGAAGGRLLASAEGWVHPAGVPAAQVDAFRAAVASAGGREWDDVEPAPRQGRVGRAPASGELRQAVFAYLLGRDPAAARADAGQATGPTAHAAAGLSTGTLQHALLRMADDAPEEILPFVRRHSADRRVRERWVQLLPESALARLSRLLGPRRHAALLDAAELLAEAWARAAPPGHPAIAGRAAFWDFLLDFLAGSATSGRMEARLVEAFFADRAARCRRLSPPPDLAQTGGALLRVAARMAHARGNARLRGILHRHRERLLGAWNHAADGAPSARRPAGEPAGGAHPPARARPARSGERPGRRRPVFQLPSRGAPEDQAEPVYVTNAGLVLAGAFLPHLFAQLDLLETDDRGRPRLRDADAVSRAVHLLQYLVDGSTDTPEPLLVLNKLLCGVPPQTPVERAVEPAVRERELCDRLLGAMLARWPALDHTSIEGLRETFLQREGRLELVPGQHRLTVQRKTLDVLVDQVPWSASVIFNDWMAEPLHVSW
jgi:hypothetical protein